MSGHSKWKNIMHKKEKTDAQRARIFTKIGREISLAVKQGGPDPASNSKLRDLIAKAKANNVPNDNIERLIKKSGGADTADYEEIRYEGYGPGGVAILVDTLTDNRNRTAGDLRHYFDKYGGNLGQSGSVAWQFEKKGIVAVEAAGVEEEALMECALEAGAEDFSREDEVYEITCAPAALEQLREALEGTGYTLLSAQAEEVPSTYVSLSGEEDVKNIQRLLELLEEHDDVQEVWHNWDSDVR